MEAGQYDTAWCGDEGSRVAQEECVEDVSVYVAYFIMNSAQSPEGSELAAADVADALVEFFEDVRTVETPVESGRAGGTGRRRTVLEPVGASLTANIELTGLRGQTVDLAWSIFKVGGDGDPLLGRWLGTIPAYRLQPSTDHDTTSVPLWTPLPPDPGRYFARLTLNIDGTALASADSREFGDEIAGDPS